MRAGLSTVAQHLVDDNAPAGNLLLAKGLQQPPGLIDPQHSGDGGNDKFCELLVPEELLHHHNAVLHCIIVTVTFLAIMFIAVITMTTAITVVVISETCATWGHTVECPK